MAGQYSAVAVSLRLLGDYGEKVTLTRELLEGTGGKESSDGQANTAAWRPSCLADCSRKPKPRILLLAPRRMPLLLVSPQTSCV